jgi:hypothetical protein
MPSTTLDLTKQARVKPFSFAEPDHSFIPFRRYTTAAVVSPSLNRLRSITLPQHDEMFADFSAHETSQLSTLYLL